MRAPFFVSLLITLVLAGVYWYQSTATICPVPLAYRLGTLDDSFVISRDEATEQIAVAAAVWESAVDRELFVYDESADFTIDFVFDERQETADAEADQRAELDAQEAETVELEATLRELQREYEELRDDFDERRSVYETNLAAYNVRVQEYNDQGGAPPEIFAELEVERERLDSEAVALDQLTDELNALGQQIKELAVRGQRQVEAYNSAVEAYNAAFGYAREFTQGDYQGDAIHIYKFSDYYELQRVLAHEFGHALGIGHVAGSSSLMYYLMSDTNATPTLSAEDRAAYTAVCGVEPTLGQRMRHLVRTTMAWF
ncbi:MAG: matrixin family metalloprotease [Patescibacteria group bacterium]